MIINSKYRNILYAIANCGFITEHIMNKYYNTNRNTIRSMVKDRYIEFKGYYLIFGEFTKIYVLTNKSTAYLKKQNKILYKSSTSQLEHDYALLKTYASLPNECQVKWENETELRLKYDYLITTDGVFLLKNKRIAVEVITPSYSKDILKDKDSFILNYCDDCIQIHTNELNKVVFKKK
ncbi:MAG: hypothetical protein QXG00_06260 [Candidatus Woesearchaeota archaeon]